MSEVFHSISMSRISRTLPTSPRFHASYACRTSSTFSSDIALAVSRQRCRLDAKRLSERLELPGEADRAPARRSPLVETVGVHPRLAAVQLEVGGAPDSCPVLGGIEELFPDSP